VLEALQTIEICWKSTRTSRVGLKQAASRRIYLTNVFGHAFPLLPLCAGNNTNTELDQKTDLTEK